MDPGPSDAGGDASVTGQLLRDGRYQLLGKLGEGAQGTTFDAIDRRAGRPVAIKRFLVKGASSWKDVELAEREAAVLASLSHPLLPSHVDHFEEGGALYLVMQKVEGQTLAALTRNGARLSQADVVAFLGDAASVLGYLHGRSPPVIHRDVNPKNVLRRPDGAFVLVDFGAVRDRLRPEGGSTVVGTFGYMAPEQFQGRAVPASDVFAVGATALRLLTGVEPEKLPHRGLALDVSAALGSSVEPALKSALERMLEPDPDRRAASLAPIVERLGRAGGAPRGAVGESHGGSRSERRREERARRKRGPWDQWEGWDDLGKLRDWADGRELGGARESRRARKRARRARRRARPVTGPPLAVALLGLMVASLVVTLVVGVLVPIVLWMLSIVFGRPLREAARQTRAASLSARESIGRARAHLLHGTPLEPEEPSVRVDIEAPPPAPPAPESPRVRVADDGVVETTGEEVPGDSARHPR